MIIIAYSFWILFFFFPQSYCTWPLENCLITPSSLAIIQEKYSNLPYVKKIIDNNTGKGMRQLCGGMVFYLQT
jgi:hypothetical protein